MLMGEDESAIKIINDKEQRWMTDLNHKISRQLKFIEYNTKLARIILLKSIVGYLRRADGTA